MSRITDRSKFRLSNFRSTGIHDDATSNTVNITDDNVTVSANAIVTGTKLTINNVNITSDGSSITLPAGSTVSGEGSIVDRMQVANTQTLHSNITANLNSYIANTNPRITNILSSVSGTNTAIRSLVSDRMQVANTQTLHSNITANLNSYIANTNPRITNILSSVSGTNTSIRSLVSDRMQVANTQSLVNARLGATSTVTLTGDVTAGSTAFSSNAVSISTTIASNSVDGSKLTDNITIAENLTVSGNLTISGTTTTVNTETINLADNTIKLNSNLGSGTAPTQNAGIAINRGSSANVEFVWDETNDYWTVGAEDLFFGDNAKAIFGAGSDLQIYHDGSKSVIQDAGTGNLVLRGSDFQLKGYTVDENMITATNNGAVYLFYDSAAKLATTATGVDITGTLTADGLTVDGASVFNQAASDQSGGAAVKANGTAYGTNKSIHAYMNTSNAAKSLIYAENGAGSVFNVDGAGDVSLYADDGTTQGFFWDASTQRLGLGLTNPAGALDVEWNSNSAGTGVYLQNDNAGSSAFAGIYFGNDVSNTDAFIGLNSSTNTQYGGTRSLLIGTNASSSVAFMTGGTQKAVITSAGNVGIGETSPVAPLDVKGSGTLGYPASGDDIPDGARINLWHNNNDHMIGMGSGGMFFTGNTNIRFDYKSGTSVNNGVSRLFLDMANGRVGIGTSSPSRLLSLNASNASIDFSNGTWTNEFINSAGQMEFRADHTNAAASSVITFSVDGSEAARLDSSGSFMAGKTATNIANDGFEAHANNYVGITRNASIPLFLNRRTDDGGLIQFRKDNAEVGSVGTVAGDLYIANAVDVGLYLESSGTDHIAPCNISGAKRDAAIDLGATSARFRDLFLSGSVYSNSYAGGSDTDTALLIDGTNIMRFVTGGGERARLTSGGGFLVGQTATNNPGGSTTTGVGIDPSGYVSANRSGGVSGIFGRISSDGPIVSFTRQGTSVGVVGASSSDVYIGTGDAGLRFQDGSDAIVPFNTTTLAASDNVLSLGGGSSRFKDLYLSNQIYGGFGAVSTGGTLNWNDSTNARSGSGYTLLLGSATNGPDGASNYYHPFNWEYSSKDGSGNMTQLAIPYINGGFHYRTRYSGSWSSWYKIWSSSNDGSGSGLDADTLDGVQGSSFLRSDAADTKTSGYLLFNDNIQARFGTGNDLQIFHDGSNSYIDDSGTGDLIIRSSAIYLQKYTGETLINAVADGAVKLYYDAAEKLATTSSGISVTGDVTSSSDERLKDNIKVIPNALDKVQQINGVSFDWKDSGRSSIGVIAQNVEKVIPEVVNENEDGYKSVTYGNMVGLLIEAMKEQQQQIEDLKSQVKELKGDSI
jgi:hypothetical protein